MLSKRGPRTSMPTTGSEIKWPTAVDWEDHRETIINLYHDQMMPLRMVRSTMVERFSFCATEKMYKDRFKSWGIRKYRQNRQNDAGPKRVQKATANRKSIKSNYVWRPDGPGSGYKSSLSCRRSSPEDPTSSSMFPLTMPEVFRAPEESMHLSQLYVTGAFTTGLWHRAPDPEQAVVQLGYIKAWYTNIGTGLDALRRQQTKEAFRMFQNAFDKYPNLLAVQDPRLLVYTLVAAVAATTVAPELVRAILVFAANICRVKFGTSYFRPHLLFDRLSSMGPTELRTNTRALLEFYFNHVLAHLDPSCPFTEEFIYVFRSLTTMILPIAGALDVDVAEGIWDSLLDRCKLLPKKDRATKILRTKLCRLNMYEETNEFARARRAVAELIHSEEIQKHPRYITYAHSCMISLARKQKSDDFVLSMVDRVVELCVADIASESSNSVLILGQIESYLREIGQEETVDRVHNEMELALNVMCPEEVEHVEISMDVKRKEGEEMED